MSHSSSRFPHALTNLLLAGVSLHFCAAGAAAQPSAQHGRSPDGRAYRIENGMKLTDYIAELEVANDDLRRQLDAAEQELADKDATLKRGGKPVPKIEEHNLIAQPVEAPRPALPPAVQPPDAAAIACNNTVQNLNSKIATLEDQLRKAQPAPVAVAAKCDYNSPENPFLARVKSLEASLTQRASDNEVLQTEHNRRLATEQELTKIKSDLDARADQAKALEQKADEAAARAAALEKQLQEAKAEQAQKVEKAAEPVRAALAQPASRNPEADAQEQPTRAPVDGGALAAAKNEFREDLQQIQSLIIERKNLLDSVKSKGKGISISIQPLVTKSGTSLDNLRLQVQKLDGSSDVGGIRSGLQQVTALLNDDVQTLKRLSK
ncbi:MAG: hypothetical protein U0136_09715 [Bdellovibrionota bacterium]